MITLEEFQKIELRVATVIGAERVPGTDKLLKLQIDLGGEQRQLVAGIAQHYTPEELLGKQIVVVANLQPAVIRGVESQGMLLAASTDDYSQLALVTLHRPLPNGCRVK
ncbi:MAG: methionine--tRNA ligase subunit beta [Candidatus Bipolaricaulota bacterium]|nr:methionine--tRNA ligase subunit beta [Candidatus Bipolaricaulota bacterium]